MSAALVCYRCGSSLAHLSLPWGRQDECPQCRVSLRVCRLCRFFDPTAVDQCTEDDAEAVREKTQANFCEYFKPRSDAYDSAASDAEQQARDQLADLFGEADK